MAKIQEKQSCVDLILSKCSRFFQNTKAISTGCSDFHKMAFTMLTPTLKSRSQKKFYALYFRFIDVNF